MTAPRAPRLIGLMLVAGCSAPPPPPPEPADPWKEPVEKASALVAKMTLAQKLVLFEGAERPMGDPRKSGGYISPIEDPSRGISIPAQYICDGPQGVGDGNTGATQFPSAVVVAATWDRALEHAYGAAMGREWVGKGCVNGMSPGINIVRLPQGGRTGEYQGEDPFHVGEMAVAQIQGIQSEHVVATVKHFAANNQETSRQSASSELGERALREIYLPAFEAAVKKGNPGAVMCSYNRFRGTYACENPYLLTDILRGEWKYPGFVMSDWTATHDTVDAVRAGTDMEMPGLTFGPGYPTWFSAVNLEAALAAGELTESQLDAMAVWILAPLFLVGAFDVFPRMPAAVVTTPAHRQLAKELSQAGTVLLKNEGNVLPLDPGDAALKIAVIGNGARDGVQTTMWGSGYVFATSLVTPLAGIEARAAGPVTYALGSSSAVPLPLLVADTGFSAVYTDAQGAVLSTGTVSPSVSHGEPYPYGVYSFDNAWPALLVSGQETAWRGTFTGALTITTARTHELQLTGLGKAAVRVDGVEVGSFDSQWIQTSVAFEVPLTAAVHTLEVRLDTSEVMWIVDRPSVSLRWNPSGSDRDAAVAAAAASDVAIVVATDVQSEGSDHPARLPNSQDALIAAVAAAAPRTIVVLNTGGALELPWVADVDAVVQGWYGGEEMGSALAAVLFGDVSPSGRTPVTWPASMSQWYAQQRRQYPGVVEGTNTWLSAHYDEGIFVGYRWFDSKALDPLFPFGHGLSYTTFEYSDLVLLPGENGRLRVVTSVKNTGTRAGSEVAQLYVGLPSETGAPPRQLQGFEKVSLAPGARASVTFDLEPRAFSYWDEATAGWVLARGTHTLMVGSSSRDIRKTATHAIR